MDKFKSYTSGDPQFLTSVDRMGKEGRVEGGIECKSQVGATRYPPQIDFIFHLQHLASVSSNGIVDVRDSYSVPHNESSNKVAMDIDYHQTMYDLHQAPTESRDQRCNERGVWRRAHHR